MRKRSRATGKGSRATREGLRLFVSASAGARCSSSRGFLRVRLSEDDRILAPQRLLPPFNLGLVLEQLFRNRPKHVLDAKPVLGAHFEDFDRARGDQRVEAGFLGGGGGAARGGMRRQVLAQEEGADACRRRRGSRAVFERATASRRQSRSESVVVRAGKGRDGGRNR